MRISAAGLYASFLSSNCDVFLDGVLQPGTCTLADEEGGFIERVVMDADNPHQFLISRDGEGPLLEVVFGAVCVTPRAGFAMPVWLPYSYRLEHDIWLGTEARP